MSSITDNVLFQSDTTKKYDIPIGHLDYSYIEKSTNVKELEKILKILRSGDEGFFPEMEKACEKKIEKLNPKSRVLRKEVPLTRPGELEKDEWQQIDNDLKDWETEMKTTEEAKKIFLDDFDNPELPPIRSGFINGHSNQVNQTEEPKKKRVMPRDYKEWDKFDIDKELNDVDKKEEPIKTGIKSKPPNIETNINTSGMTDEEKMMKAGREKEKGNEAFRAGDYEESISYYTRSIKLHSTAASYNNRAIAYLKTSQWTNAVEDCNRVLKIEPENIKALLRRGTGYKGMKEFNKSLEDFNKVLLMEPENKRAQDHISELKEEEMKNEEEKKQRKEKGRRMVIEEVDEESEDEIVVDKKPEEKKEKPEKIQVLNGHVDKEEIEKIQVTKESEEKNSSNQSWKKRNESKVSENSKQKGNKSESKIKKVSNEEKGKEVKNVEENRKEEKNVGKNIWSDEEIIEEKPNTSVSIENETTGENSKNKLEGSKLQNDNESRLEFPPTSEKQTDMGSLKGNGDLESKDNQTNEKLESEKSEKMENESAILARPVLVQNPLSPGVAALRESGNNLFKTGQYGEAVKKYTSAIEKVEKEKTDQKVNLSLLYSNRAACYLKTGDCSHTIKDCTKALELVPHSIKPLLRRGSAYEMIERYRPAYADYKHVLSIDSSVDMALHGSSRCQKHLIEVDGSKWREKLPRVPSVQSWEIPEIVDSGGKPASSTLPSQPTSSLKTSSSSSSQPISNSVPSSSEKKKSPEEQFEELKSEGNSYVQKGQYQDAVPCYTKCIEVLPDKVVSYTNRSLCYLKLNKAQEAETDCTKALTLEKDNVKALFRRAQARKNLKKNKESLEDLNHLLKVDPKNTAAKKEMDIVKSLWREELNAMKKQMENKPRKRIVIEETDSEEEREDKDEPVPVSKEKTKTQTTTEPKKTVKQTEPIKQEKTTPAPTPKQHEQKNTKTTKKESPKEQQTTGGNSKQKSKSPPSSSIKPTSFGLPQSVPKLEKATPYEFISAWNALKQSMDLQPYADLLRQIKPDELPKVISNKLDGGMLSKITKCVSEKYTDDLTTSYQILKNVSKVPRFETIAMFMSKAEKKDVETVLNKVETAGGVASKEEITQLKKKYSL